MRRLPVAVALLLSACDLPEHKNPFDPATAPALQARAILSGRVTLEASGGVAPSPAGITVSVLGLPSVTTASDGTWRVEQVPPGTYTVRASKDASWVDAVVAGVRVTLDDGDRTIPVADLELRVARGSIAGTATLTGASDASAIQVALATLSSPTPIAAAVTNYFGGWRLDGVPVGTYDLVVSRSPGYVAQTIQVTILAQQESDAGTVQLALDLSGGLHGTVAVARPLGANDLVDVLLSGADLNGNPVVRSTQTTDASTGAWQIDLLPQGTYTVTFRKARYDDQRSSGLFVAAGRVVTLPLVVLPVATVGISGTVQLDVGSVPGFPALADRSGTVVTLADGLIPIATAVTDAAGGYLFQAVPALTVAPAYTLSAQRPYFGSASRPVSPPASLTLAGMDLTLTLSAGSLSGSVVLWDSVGGAGANAQHDGARVAITGTSFNGLAWTPPPVTTASPGTWQVNPLPPGTYDVTLTSAGRTCETYGQAVVGAGAAIAAGSRRCTDALPPGAVGLGSPLPVGSGISGWVSGSTVTIPIAAAATDATVPATNLRGYQTVLGAAPNWAAATLVPVAPVAPTQLVVGGLTPNVTNTVWVRAIDWTDNAGLASSVQVQQDSVPPVAPTINSPRSFVPDTTATVTFTGSDTEPSFLRYEACTVTVVPGSACPGVMPCTLAAVAQSYPVLLAANQRTCLWARAVDKAGLTSGVVTTSIVSDIAAPTPPVFRPAYDPTAVTLRAEWVDLFLATPSTDPAWIAPWKGIAWIEVDSGQGFEPICPAAACHPNDRYDPCAVGCGCADPRLRCSGTTFTALRVPLATASRNRITVRAVDLAGTASSGVSHDIATETTAGVIAATSSNELLPSLVGNVLTYTRYGVGQVIVDLGGNRRFDATDTTCTIANGGYGVLASRSLLAYTNLGQIALRRPAAGAAFCGADTTTNTGIPVGLYLLGASGERIAYVGGSSGAYTLAVREPGPNRLVGDGDDVTTSLGTYTAVWEVQLGGGHVLAMLAGAPTGGQMAYRVISASGNFATAYTTLDLPYSSVSLAGLSPDGSMLAYTDTSIGSVVVRYPTAGHYTSGDVKVTRPLPPGFVGANTASIVVDGTHVVVADAGIGALLHWDAGPDGTFGTADDLYAQLKPSKVRRQSAAMSSGLLVYEEGLDLFAVDLTSVRWEDVPSGYQTSGALVTAASGSVFFGGTNPFGGAMPLYARCADGRDTTLGTYPNWFSADGDYVVYDSSGLWLGTRDTGGASPSGCFFTGSSTTQQIFASSIPLHSVVLGETVLAANRPWGGTSVTTVTAIEPTTPGQPLTTGQTAVQLATGIDYPYGIGLTDRQAVYYCGRLGTGYQVCVKGKGAGNLFRGAGAPVETVLRHPPTAPVGAGTVIGAQAVKVSGRRAVLGALPAALYLIDAGPDGDLNTADDTETLLLSQQLDVSEFDISGNWVAYIAAGSPGGDQIYLYSIADQAHQQLTFHLSTKKNVAVDPRGRVWWEDSVLGTTWSIWVRTP